MQAEKLEKVLIKPVSQDKQVESKEAELQIIEWRSREKYPPGVTEDMTLESEGQNGEKWRHLKPEFIKNEEIRKQYQKQMNSWMLVEAPPAKEERRYK